MEEDNYCIVQTTIHFLLLCLCAFNTSNTIIFLLFKTYANNLNIVLPLSILLELFANPLFLPNQGNKTKK